MKPADYLFWALKQKTGNPIRNYILVQLCNRAGKNGTCFPSNKTIADDCGCSERAVRDHLKVLELDGFIAVERRAVDGMKTSNLYSFPPAKSDRQDLPNDRQDLPNGTANGSTTVRQEMPIKHPVLNTQLNTHITPCSPPPESDFDKFYETYPKKTGRDAAEKAWKKLNPPPALINRIMQDVVARVDQGHWCTGKDKGFIPGPAPYLNQKRWTDEIIPRPGFKPATDFAQLCADTQDLTENF